MLWKVVILRHFNCYVFIMAIQTSHYNIILNKASSECLISNTIIISILYIIHPFLKQLMDLELDKIFFLLRRIFFKYTLVYL